MEGRAGMAAVVSPGKASELDLQGLAEALAKQLPPYAVPIFLRVVEQVDITGLSHSFPLHLYVVATGGDERRKKGQIVKFDKARDFSLPWTVQ